MEYELSSKSHLFLSISGGRLFATQPSENRWAMIGRYPSPGKIVMSFSWQKVAKRQARDSKKRLAYRIFYLGCCFQRRKTALHVFTGINIDKNIIFFSAIFNNDTIFGSGWHLKVLCSPLFFWNFIVCVQTIDGNIRSKQASWCHIDPSLIALLWALSMGFQCLRPPLHFLNPELICRFQSSHKKKNLKTTAY